VERMISQIPMASPRILKLVQSFLLHGALANMNLKQEWLQNRLKPTSDQNSSKRANEKVSLQRTGSEICEVNMFPDLLEITAPFSEASD